LINGLLESAGSPTLVNSRSAAYPPTYLLGYSIANLKKMTSVIPLAKN